MMGDTCSTHAAIPWAPGTRPRVGIVGKSKGAHSCVDVVSEKRDTIQHVDLIHRCSGNKYGGGAHQMGNAPS